MPTNMTRTLVFAFCLLSLSINAQDFADQLFKDYDQVRENTLNVQRIKHSQLQPLIKKYAGMEGYTVREVGKSIDGRSLSLISVGSGDIDILLWSQMHGNEPTATMAIFDILNMLSDKKLYNKAKKEMLSKVTVHFLPMLNPDGAESFTRRNLLDIDINRDALRLQTPEGQTLKYVRDSLEAEFGFNLHDQSIYSNANLTEKPATISYLAPAYNYEKEVNEVRGNAMKVIVLMNDILQRHVPGQVGRYPDDFEPRAFGDNIQKWGTSAILIESGGHYDDPEKQFIRKLNYMSITSAMFSIADESYKSADISKYELIPNNDRKLFDLKIEAATYWLKGKPYTIDVAIRRNKVDNKDHTSYNQVGSIAEVGDLSTYYGYEMIDATGLTIAPAEIKSVTGEFSALDFKSLLSDGIAYLKVAEIENKRFTDIPLNILKDNADAISFGLGNNATFLLKKGDEIKYVIVNGFLFDPAKDDLGISNGIVIK